MKYIVFVFRGRVAVDEAGSPNMDALASMGELGTVRAGIGDFRADSLKPGDGIRAEDIDAGAACKAADSLLSGGCGIVFIHVGDAADEVLGEIRARMDASLEPYRLLLLSGTTEDEVLPYVIYDSTRQLRRIARYSLCEAEAADISMGDGETLFKRFIGE